MHNKTSTLRYYKFALTLSTRKISGAFAVEIKGLHKYYIKVTSEVVQIKGFFFIIRRFRKESQCK